MEIITKFGYEELAILYIAKIKKKYLESIIKNFDSGVIILDKENNIQLINYSALDILCFEQDNYKNKSIVKIINNMEISCKEEILEKTEDVRVDIQGRGRILAMDDEEMIRSLIQQMLHRMGYEVELANDGEQAIGLYQRAIETGKPFDAVILDLTVPGAMGGKEAAGRLREIDTNVKIIVSSGYSIDPVMSNYEEYGFCGVVEKPYSLQRLGEALEEILNLEYRSK